MGTAHGRPLSRDLDTLDRIAGLANLAAGPAPVGEDASAIAAYLASDRTQSRLATRPRALERSRAKCTAGTASATLHRSETDSTTEVVRTVAETNPELDQAVEAQAGQRPQACRLLTHPGAGPVTALATEVFGDPNRFATGNQVASYIEIIPCEHSGGKRQRLRKLIKQGNSLLRYLWTEATLHAVQNDPELKQFYRCKLIQKGMGKARIAAARELGIRFGS